MIKTIDFFFINRFFFRNSRFFFFEIVGFFFRNSRFFLEIVDKNWNSL